MRTFKTRWFHRWAKKATVKDESLSKAVDEMEQGLIDADLGGHIYKKRVATQGGGKRGGVRTLIAYQVNEKAFFVYGFAKNKKDNISDKELMALQAVASTLLSHDDEMLQHLIETGDLVEVYDDE